MPKPDIHRLLAFQQLLLKFREVQRVTHVPDTHEAENDTEHSYNLALTAWFLAEYFPALDKDQLIRFALVHDLVEVYAGDTYIYADASIIATKKARETKALQQLEKEWPDFPDMLAAIHAYETRGSDEAKFIYALDKIMPIMVIFLSGGYTWKKEGITHDLLHEVKQHKVAVSPEIESYYNQLYQLLLDNTHLFGSKSAKP
jgi:putative hydrolases of HD superfamily